MKQQSNGGRKKGRAKTGKVNRRGQILAATEQILRSRGLSGATTRNIAETVGCSEGALYVHFNNRAELLLAVLDISLPDMLEPVHALKTSAGKGSPQKNLEKALEGIFKFHRRVTPMIASLFAEPDLLDRYRKSLARDGKGPRRAIRNLAAFIRREQDLGRIPSNIDAQLAATLLMSASFFRAFTEQFFGAPAGPSTRRFFRQAIASVTSSTPK